MAKFCHFILPSPEGKVAFAKQMSDEVFQKKVKLILLLKKLIIITGDHTVI